MSKPEEVSQEAWEAASELLYDVEANPSDVNIVIIARALHAARKAEREACEKIASGHAGVDRADAARFTAGNIAAAIRKRGEA